jgi:hypothetical protein
LSDPTGCAAPTRVPGAIAATSVASRMNAPADVACAVAGSTNPMTGIGEFVMSLTMSSIDDTRPPGVLIDMMTNEAFRWVADSIAWWT